jgi:very-short-patch-repair endonuclease
VIRGLAERQHGVVARRQLLALGLSAELVDGRLVAGYLAPIYEGVFAVGRARLGRYGRWMAAVLATGPNSVLSHGSAAELWAMRGSRGDPEVTRRSGGTTRRGVRLHQTRVLDPSETTVEAGIPVTSIERTLVDIAARLDPRQLERAVVAADRTGQLRWPELERLLARTPRRPGACRLRRIAHKVSPRAVDAKSTLEIDFLALCREAGLAAPQVNVLVEGFLIDFLWPAERLIVETDTYGFHGDRLAFERDRERSMQLMACGYEVHRITKLMLRRDPNRFLGLVQQALARRRASRLPPISRQR